MTNLFSHKKLNNTNDSDVKKKNDLTLLSRKFEKLLDCKIKLKKNVSFGCTCYKFFISSKYIYVKSCNKINLGYVLILNTFTTTKTNESVSHSKSKENWSWILLKM
jgi:hypothetical protein